MQLYTSDERHAWLYLYGTSPPGRSASKATKSKLKKSCPKWDTNPQYWNMKSDTLPTELTGLRLKLSYLKDLYTHKYFRYQRTYWYKPENDEVERICLAHVLFCFKYWNIIYPYWTNSKEANQSCACCQYANHNQTFYQIDMCHYGQ